MFSYWIFKFISKYMWVLFIYHSGVCSVPHKGCHIIYIHTAQVLKWLISNQNCAQVVTTIYKLINLWPFIGKHCSCRVPAIQSSPWKTCILAFMCYFVTRWLLAFSAAVGLSKTTTNWSEFIFWMPKISFRWDLRVSVGTSPQRPPPHSPQGPHVLGC